MLIVLWILLTILIAVWASRWNRSPTGWFFVALIFSPVISAVALLIAGRVTTDAETQAQVNKIDARKNEFLFLRDEFMHLYISNEDKYSKNEAAKDVYVKLANSSIDYSLIPTLKTMISIMK
ncbi:hypothetical protein HP234_003126 [Salmonella enterica subsp. enterica]|nr:hypothetical protein [Salmonella enterica subsp. enterica]